MKKQGQTIRRHFQLEGGESIRCDDVLSVIDFDQASRSGATQQFLKENQKQLRVVNLAHDLPNTIVTVRDVSGIRIYLSGLSTEIVYKRIQTEGCV